MKIVFITLLIILCLAIAACVVTVLVIVRTINQLDKEEEHLFI
jgi:hypothetical protein